jgi:hypothetical protein
MTNFEIGFRFLLLPGAPFSSCPAMFTRNSYIFVGDRSLLYVYAKAVVKNYISITKRYVETNQGMVFDEYFS